MRTVVSWLLGGLALALSGCGAVSFDPVTDFLGDSDGDGFTDNEEADASSDPNNPFDWDFSSGRWPDFEDEAIRDGVGGPDAAWALGAQIPDDRFYVDQYGNQVSLYTFYGYVVVLDFVAGWCDACVVSAPLAQPLWVEHRLDGFLVIHIAIDDEVDDQANVVHDGFVRDWAAFTNAEFPVLAEPDLRAFGELWGMPLADGSDHSGQIPLQVVLDQDLRVDSGYVGSAGLEEATERALELIGR